MSDIEKLLEDEVLKQSNVSTWEDKARADKNIQAWYKEMQTNHPEEKGDVIDFMKSTPKDVYDYEAMVREGVTPSYQEEHKQYRWKDKGKGKSHPNLDNKN